MIVIGVLEIGGAEGPCWSELTEREPSPQESRTYYMSPINKKETMQQPDDNNSNDTAQARMP